VNLQTRRIQYGAIERIAMRLLFAIVIAQQIPESFRHTSIPAPNGFARLVDLHVLLDAQVFTICRYAGYAALVLYVFRIGWAVVLPYLTLLCIAIGSINNSQGAIAHNFQIVPLVLLAQTAAFFYTLFRQRDAATAENRMIFWSQQAIVATYLVSALTKLIHTSGKWFIQSPRIGVQIIKTTEQDYYDRLDASGLERGAAIAEWIVHHPWITGAALSAGLLLELTAPAALLGRRFALFYGASLLAFHASIGQVMQLRFAYNEYLIWVFLVNVPFWAMRGAQRIAAMRTAGPRERDRAP
jgi:hypothetical protein